MTHVGQAIKSDEDTNQQINIVIDTGKKMDEMATKKINIVEGIVKTLRVKWVSERAINSDTDSFGLGECWGKLRWEIGHIDQGQWGLIDKIVLVGCESRESDGRRVGSGRAHDNSSGG